MMDLEPLVGEPLALDLVNTLTAEGDLLATTEQVRHWLELESERLKTGPGVDAATVAAVRVVREHIAAVVGALLEGEAPPPAALSGLEATLAAAPVRTSLGWDGAAVTVTTEREGDGAQRLAARLAEAAIELIGDPGVGGLRRCEAPDCVLVFLPAHPRRRWCSPDRCGNRVRVARHYQRRKASGTAGSGPG